MPRLIETTQTSVARPGDEGGDADPEADGQAGQRHQEHVVDAPSDADHRVLEDDRGDSVDDQAMLHRCADTPCRSASMIGIVTQICPNA